MKHENEMSLSGPEFFSDKNFIRSSAFWRSSAYRRQYIKISLSISLGHFNEFLEFRLDGQSVQYQIQLSVRGVNVGQMNVNGFLIFN